MKQHEELDPETGPVGTNSELLHDREVGILTIFLERNVIIILKSNLLCHVWHMECMTLTFKVNFHLPQNIKGASFPYLLLEE